MFFVGVERRRSLFVVVCYCCWCWFVIGVRCWLLCVVVVFCYGSYWLCVVVRCLLMGVCWLFLVKVVDCVFSCELSFIVV